MTKLVPIFVAAMVLLIRVLLINTFSIAGERLFSMADERDVQYQNKPVYRPNETLRTPNTAFPRPAPKPNPVNISQPAYNEPSYHPIGMSAQPRNDTNTYTRR